MNFFIRAVRSSQQIILTSGRQFSEPEAWRLFRFAAFGEAIGWTLLITGIVITTYVTPGNRDAVVVAGQLHGTLFLLYLAASLIFSISLGWPFRKTLVAVLASLPPYGTLVFERLAARSRALKLARDYRRLEVRALIAMNGQILAVQFRENTDWQLPGGQVTVNETLQAALVRQVHDQIGVTPKLGEISSVIEETIAGKSSVTVVFTIKNSRAFGQRAQYKQGSAIDEIAFVEPAKLVKPDLKRSYHT